jgi:L-ascorbate metabolism protein UlaG (beta-lactamase superfamily)
MKIQHIRHACMAIHSKEHKILVDPCLGPKGSLPPYTLFRKKPKFNPVVDLPPNSESMLSQITSGLITHCRYGHFDHLDKSGVRLLSQNHIPVYCNKTDETFLKRRHIKAIPLTINQKSSFLTGSITPISAKHGHGLIGKLMGSGAGYFIELPNEKSIYISGDTILTPSVRDALSDLKPDISILNAGTATLDFGKPILMTVNEQLEFMKTASNVVIAVHLDAFNHCLTSRSMLKDAVSKAGLSEKVMIPLDGELIEI